MKDDIKDLVQKIIEEEDGEIRSELCEVLVGFKQEAVLAILPCLQNEDWQIRYRMIRIIAQIGVKNKDGFLSVEEAFLVEEDDDVRRMMMQCLLTAQVPIVTDFSGDVKGKKTKKIWKFAGEEAETIKEMFAEENIIYREHVVCCGHPDYPSYREEVTFEVVEDEFDKAIGILKDFFGLGSGSGFTGECPACGTEIESAATCPECGLNLEMDPNEVIQYHPFGEFLSSLGE
ncbi:HEAT repeat domain-containing protein [Candidatus Uabimicrobium sp. HlEnr_7]|uniref:HEAT repeat domain-containing protein n=1 Tax=Candidatus Uabimicrobium helgolandensis TaxID=3095367 RepID=UPI003555D2EE